MAAGKFNHTLSYLTRILSGARDYHKITEQDFEGGLALVSKNALDFLDEKAQKQVEPLLKVYLRRFSKQKPQED